MKQFESWVTSLSNFVWGPHLLILLIGTGIFLTFRLGFIQVTRLGFGLKEAFIPKQKTGVEAEKRKRQRGDISHFQALMTALAATVGTGNMVGVATAIVLGGPGAIVWMWLSGFIGMATKYAEAILAVKYRTVDERGEVAGGPMYYLEHGLKKRWLGMTFALFASIAAFGIGNGVQTNSISLALNTSFGVPMVATGIIMMVLTGFVILGGVKSIGKVVGIFVPVMIFAYVGAGLVILVTNFDLIPSAFATIFSSTFSAEAIGGGALGAAIRYGVARGVFSNEAGLGSAPIAAAAAKTDFPGRQALVSMTQVLIDTLIVCSITGLTIVMGGQYTEGLQGIELTQASFAYFLGPIGELIVTISLVFFAFSTVIGWCYYGERSVHYLLGERAIVPYRMVYIVVAGLGAMTTNLNLIWAVSDVFNGLMAIPNLIGLLFLSGVVVAETKRFELEIRKERQQSAA
ncbi:MULTISPECIES: sodium:alanine symporter family protein [unclassified Exiguobacterium]|uniref:alanine/glycine:cation symporter family protein n=1 Tax=unclassified Exiguobacterium TaxID=2644629 RepID=UPI00103D777A|nr:MULTISPECIES: sodium:alanine symporter family protein [unclassified Exiguobacterium]TCI39209.1 sodium:alanine symporter family protein [Exiguobacterium sp. SH4S7]TCI63002.1 sodium:alanine symporter family protein [Exiguobacterium sp. SH0S2]